MAFPTVLSTGYSEQTSNTATHTVTLPATFYADSLLLLFISMDGNRTISDMPTGWVELFNVNGGGPGRGIVYYLIAVGTETSFTYTSSGNEQSTNRVFAIGDWHGTTVPEVSADASGTDTAPDSASVTPSWGAEDTMWFAFFGSGASTTVSGFPTDFADDQYSGATAGPGGITYGVASRSTNATSQDPAAFTIADSDDWAAATVAVRTGSAGGAPLFTFVPTATWF